jgi:hypothetical protein
MQKEKPGRPIDIKSVTKVREYREKGLNQSEIARVMKKTRQQVNRWFLYLDENKVYFIDENNNVDNH